MLRNSDAYVSFTFDDFPRSALLTGGSILERFGMRGTYYASFGLMGRSVPTGSIFLPGDLRRLLEAGHELGCHTFDHCDAWRTSPAAFEESVVRNRRALSGLLPGTVLRTLSSPMSPPRAHTKRRMQSHFLGCRGGGQTFNVGTTDLNNLRAFFIEQSRDDLLPIRRLIEENKHARGWLILATHDVGETTTRFGCSPATFEQVAGWVARSGARVLPVGEVLTELGVPQRVLY